MGSEAKKQLCADLGADVVIDYNVEDFAEVVMEATNDRGVDVVFDGVGEGVMDRSMHCIGYNGRYLMVGFASDKSHADEKLIVPRRISAGNFKLCGVLLAYATFRLGSFWFAFLVHSTVALSNEWFSLAFHPEMNRNIKREKA